MERLRKKYCIDWILFLGIILRDKTVDPLVIARDELGELRRGQEHLTGLCSVGRSDKSEFCHAVDDTCASSEADVDVSLQEGGCNRSAFNRELERIEEELVEAFG